ncbi:fos-related antigen 2 isoform X2 [Denticeps clupeoides]|uniref:fos-related antigen 2 isoform X2 n=1 Tax=Denticeps clupeoides TaxID=299321 RepID=UPI0010A57D60|nr:fos-related antigen 2-like isoform X2 [Denticeps clupeoides]
MHWNGGNGTSVSSGSRYAEMDPGGTGRAQQVRKVPGPAMSTPSLDAITSNQDLQWLLQSSLWSQPDATQQALATLRSPEEPECRPPAQLQRPGPRKGTDDKMSQQEAERRRLRRERNRLAAAKCRDRRRVLTDTLQNESDQLESVQSRLQEEITRLEREKEKLELVLEAHKPVCKIVDTGCPQH